MDQINTENILNEEFYRKNYLDSIISIIAKEKIEFEEYNKTREKFLTSFKHEESSFSNKEDLLSNLLQEMNMPEQESSLSTPIINLKKITDKDKFKIYLDALKKDFEIYQNLILDFYSEVSFQPDISEDMEVAELRDAIVGVFKEVVPLIILEQNLTNIYNKNENLLDRLSDFSLDCELIELKEKLEEQKRALMEINNYFTDKDKKHLIKGLDVIEKDYNILIRVNDAISNKEIEKELITCFRCSGKNPPGSRTCKICKAVLPFTSSSSSSIEVSETGEIVDALLGDVQNEDVKYFKRILDRFLKGKVDKQAIKDYIDKFNNKVIITKNNFERTIKPFLIKNKDIKELHETAEQFINIMDEYKAALNEGNIFFTDEDTDHLNKGFSMMVEANKNMKKIMHLVNHFMTVYSEKSED